jgi:hypothetical protein
MASTSTKSIIAALDDPDLFGGMFNALSWEPWRAFLAALQGLPMSDGHLALYRHHTGRSEPPTRPARYAELVVGRRGGKSRVLALIATYLACVLDHSAHIVPGEVPVVAVIAKDRTQARVILSYIAGLLRSIPLFAELIEDELAESIRLSNGVVIEVHTASIGAPRGRTFLAVLCDETAFWPVEGDSANVDVEVINAVRPGLSTIPYSLLLIASSPYAKRGILYANYAKYFGKDDAPVLVWQGTTEEMNSSLIGDPLIAEMYAEDHERASAEFGALFRSDLEAFVSREVVEACIDRGVHERPHSPSLRYLGGLDPSGGSSDSMTACIGHMDPGGLIVIDAVRERRPPFSPEAVTNEFAAFFKSYNVRKVQSDKYAGLWPAEAFHKVGIEVEQSARAKSELYQDMLAPLNSGNLRLVDNPRLVSQLCSLERRVGRSGKDSIAEPSGQHDDIANSVAIVAAGFATTRSREMSEDGLAKALAMFSDRFALARSEAEIAAQIRSYNLTESVW